MSIICLSGTRQAEVTEHETCPTKIGANIILKGVAGCEGCWEGGDLIFVYFSLFSINNDDLTLSVAVPVQLKFPKVTSTLRGPEASLQRSLAVAERKKEEFN